MIDPYKSLAGKLKDLGLIKWDLRKPLNRGHKATVTKLYDEWRHVIKNPQDFHQATVKPDTAKLLKETGFKVTKKNRAWIPKGNYERVQIEKDRITRTATDGEKETTFLDRGETLDQRMRKLFDRKLKRNEMLSFRVGDSSPFNVRFSDYNSARHYMSQWQPKDPGADKQKLMGLMTIVKIPFTPGHASKKPTRKKPQNKRGK